ncbi:MAG: outer membrane protein assembly factor [Flavobacteriaceae bacterium]|nr:outer membrane protein assembly factor [Flavobacteriaceae bacterium]
MKWNYYLSLLSISICLSGWAQQIEEVVFEGNSKTKTAFLKRISSIELGSRLDSTLLEDNKNWLQRFPAIAHASYAVEKNANGNYKLIYRVVENFTIIPFGNLYGTHNESLAIQIGLAEHNLLGRGMRLGGYFQHDVFNSYEMQFNAPYLFGKNIGISIGHKNRTTQEPVYFGDFAADYRYQIKTLELMTLIQLNTHHRIETGINIFNEDYQYLQGGPEDAFKPELNIDKRLFRMFHEYNKLAYDYQYIDGLKNQVTLQYITNDKSGVNDFVIGWNDFFYFQRIGQRGNWANRFRIGFSSNEETPFAPFALDNNVNIRGVGLDIDRGTGVISYNTEYRHSLIDNNNWVVQSNTFVDIGSWRSAGGSISDMFKSENIKLYPGIGLRLMHKKIYNAILRIDYGIGIGSGNNQGIVFGLGQYF